MRVGGLGVVDVAHATDDADLLGAVPADLESAQSGFDRPRQHPHRAGQGRRAQGVEDPDRPGHRYHLDRCQRQIVGESAVDEHTIADPEFTGRRDAEPKAGLNRGCGAGQQRRRRRVVETHHCHPAVEGTGLGRRIGLKSAVPVEMILGHVEHDTGLGSQRRRPEQLEARYLHGQQVSRLVQHVENGVADVAAQHRGPPVGDEHVVEHRGGGGLAVGPGHHQPPPRRTVDAGRIQSPGEFDVAPDRNTRPRRGNQNRRRRRKARTGDHQIETPGSCDRLGGGDPGGAAQPPGCGLVVVADRHLDILRRQRADHRASGDPRTGHQYPRSRRQRQRFGRHVSRQWR